MLKDNPTGLPVAVRVYPDTAKPRATGSTSEKRWRRPDSMFVFDSETRIDATQRLIIGSYRFLQKGECMEEGLFYGDDVSESERTTLGKYISEHTADAVSTKLHLLTRSEFVDKLFKAGYKGRSLIIRFNLS